MLTTIQRIRVYASVIILSVILVAVFFGISARLRLADIRTLNEVRNLSNALERYKLDMWRYPAGNRIDVRKGVILSEQGFGPGRVVYYQGGIPSSHAVTYLGKDDSYVINFTLRRRWPEQGLTGTKCTVTTLFTLTCGT